MSSDELSSEEPTCECCGCTEPGHYFTPCCHARLCDKHEEELMITSCSNEKCSNNVEEYCKECFDLNSVSNRCYNCNHTWCDNKSCGQGKHDCPRDDEMFCTACKKLTDGGACDDGTTCAYCNAPYCENCLGYVCKNCACCSNCEGKLKIYSKELCKKCTHDQCAKK